jgi:8-oxo-dGTP diphosphatase
MEKLIQCKVKAILNNSNNEILFIKNREKENDNTVQLPQGIVQYGEYPESSLKRIIMENTKIDVEPLSILGIYSKIDESTAHHSITVVFICIILHVENDPNPNNSQFTCLWLNKYSRRAINLGDEDTKILNHYELWRSDKSTFWTSKP